MTTRELAWRDRFTNYLQSAIVSDTAGDSIFNDLVLEPNAEYALVLKLTGNEYVKMFSALMTGADLSFPSEAHEIVWLLWKAAKDMVLCDEVAQCIYNSGEVGTALIDFQIATASDGGAGNPDRPLPDSVLQENLLPGEFTCDNDHRYGTAVGIVQAIHDATLEVFQAIEVLTNPIELAAELGDNIPLASLAGSALDVARWVQDTIYESYILAWSDTVKDEISCEIYCEMLPYDPCKVTFEMVFDIYKDVDGVSPPSLTGTWAEWFAWLVLLPVTVPVQVVKVAGLLGLLIMRYGGKFGDFVLGVRSFKTTVELLADDTNPDWAVLCTACPSRWSHTWDFEANDVEDFAITTHGSFVLDQGATGGTWNDGSYNRHGIFNLRKFGLIERCDTLIVRVDQVRGAFSYNSDAQAFYLLDASFQPIGLNEVRGQGGVLTGYFEWEFNFALTNAVNGLYVQLYTAVQDDGEPFQPGSIIIRSITLGGVGTDPFE